MEAAKAANAHDFIMRLPDKYDTKLGERGSQLSGGERQRISIARAFLKDAPILILDEPTSSIDSKTEAVILDSLERLAAGRTTLTIAHRLSTIRNADLILVLNHGRLVERGTHEDLLEHGGLYQRLYVTQAGGAQEKASFALLTASPNPIPAGDGPGTTTISWDTGDGSPGQVYVSVDGAEEKLFAGGADGSREVGWIQPSKEYEFRLYAGTEKATLLDAVTVTRSGEALLTASPNPISAGDGPGTTTISWDTGDSSPGQVYVSVDGGEEKLFAGGAEGSREAGWIQPSKEYEFRLYAGTERAALLDAVTVSHEERQDVA